MFGGIALLAAIVLGVVTSSVGAPEEVKAISVGVSSAIGLIGIIVGLAWPHLRSSECDPKTIVAHFADESDYRDWIVVHNVHPGFVADLPEDRSDLATRRIT